MATIETDYLVVGAGATGMSFTDTMLEVSDREVVLVDRRHRPGGHWNDAYPFVKLHQPAAFYGVGSTPLVGEHADAVEARQGLATCTEVCEYFLRVLEDGLLATGRVEWLPKTDFVGGEDGTYQLRSLVTGETTTVKVRKKLVDARYQEMTIPKLHTPNFRVDDAVRFMPPNDLVDLDRPASGYTVLGGGKTAMDTCYWLLERGVDPADIRWVRSRDAWTMDRDSFRADDDGLSFVRMQGSFLAAAAEAVSAADMCARLEKLGVLHRLDDSVEPGFFRGATLSGPERDALRRVENVVRLGRVTDVGMDTISLEQGSIPNDPEQVVVDCTACGVPAKAAEPIFQPGKIHMDVITFGIIPWSAAVTAWFEANVVDDDQKNERCPRVPFDGEIETLVDVVATTLAGAGARMGVPEFAAWEDQLRVNPANGFNASLPTSTEAQQAMGDMMAGMGGAMENLTKLMAARAA